MINKDEKFYQYMGKFFGSRLVEKQTNDRIYDDNGKVIKTLERKYCDNNLATITEILPDSSKKITYCSAPVGKYDHVSSYKIIDDAPKEIIHKDAKGEIIKSLIYSDSYKFNADLDIQTKDINCFISIPFNEKRYDENHPPPKFSYV